MPWREWYKGFGPLLGACIAILIIRVAAGSWQALWVLLGFVIATPVVLLLRWFRYRMGSGRIRPTTPPELP